MAVLVKKASMPWNKRQPKVRAFKSKTISQNIRPYSCSCKTKPVRIVTVETQSLRVGMFRESKPKGRGIHLHFRFSKKMVRKAMFG